MVREKVMPGPFDDGTWSSSSLLNCMVIISSEALCVLLGVPFSHLTLCPTSSEPLIWQMDIIVWHVKFVILHKIYFPLSDNLSDPRTIVRSEWDYSAVCHRAEIKYNVFIFVIFHIPILNIDEGFEICFFIWACTPLTYAGVKFVCHGELSRVKFVCQGEIFMLIPDSTLLTYGEISVSGWNFHVNRRSHPTDMWNLDNMAMSHPCDDDSLRRLWRCCKTLQITYN